MSPSNIPESLWQALDRLVAEQPLVIDRPRGTAHPAYPDMLYPMDYGHLQGTLAGDGAEVDAWLGSRRQKTLDGLLLTVDALKKDVEVKLCLGCTTLERHQVQEFYNRHGLVAGAVPRQPDLIQSITTRRSVRQFQSLPVPDDMLQAVIETACQAPSAHNRQPWRFAIIASQKLRERLADQMGTAHLRDSLAGGMAEADALAQVARSRRRLLEAPAVILLCLDQGQVDVYPDAPRQQAALLMMVQSVAMAGQNLLLAAHAYGLAAVWLCAPLFAGEIMRNVLDLPASWLPQGMVYLGYSAINPPVPPRLSLDQLIVFKE